jgi:hypothetical protein
MPRPSDHPDTPATSVSAWSAAGSEGGDANEVNSNVASERIQYNDNQRLFVEVTDTGVAVSCCGKLADFVVTDPGKEFVRDLYDINVVNTDGYTLVQRRIQTKLLIKEAIEMGEPIELLEDGDVECTLLSPPANFKEVGRKEWQTALKDDITVVPESVQGTGFGWEYAYLPEGETGPEGCKGYMRKYDPVSGVESRWKPNLEGFRAQEDDRIK